MSDPRDDLDPDPGYNPDDDGLLLADETDDDWDRLEEARP